MLPLLFGKFPRIIGVFAVLARLIVGGTTDQVVSELAAEMVMGAPEAQLKMPPNCHRSTMRERKPGALLKNFRPGPKGNSSVPLLRKSCVRWKPRSAWLRLRF